MTTSIPRRGRGLSTALVGFAVAALALTACSSDGGSDAGASESASDSTATSTGSAEAADFGDIAVQLSWIKNEEFSGEFFALENGYYDEAGLGEVTLTPGPSTGAAELISGTVDVALSDAVSIGSVVASEGAPLKIIGTTFQKNPFTVLSLADGANISTPQDLVGKKIGVQDSNTALFNALLAANDIDPSSVEIVPVQYDPAPLVSGEVDGFIAYLTNEALTVAAEGHPVTNLAFADNGLPFVAESVAVTQEAIDSSREKLKAFLVAEIRGWTDAVNDPEEGARLAYEVYGADLDLDPTKTIAGAKAQVDLIVSDETATNGLFTISDALQDSTIKSLAGAGITLKASDLFDLSLLDEVYKENPDLVAYAG